MPGYMKKKKAVKKPKRVHAGKPKAVKKPKDGHKNGEMKKAMKFVSAVRKAMMAYGKK